MPENNKSRRNDGENRNIRSMKDAVEDIVSFTGGAEQASEEKTADAEKPKKKPRVYGDDRAHRAERSEKSPDAQKKRRKKRKKKRSLLGSGDSDKKIRRDESQPWTLFGHKLSFWPFMLILFAALMLLVFLLDSTNLSIDEQPVTIMALSPDAEGYRILTLSDLNGRRFGDRQSTLLREIDSLDFDIVVCLGDMVGEDGDPEPFYELLDGLPSGKQVYFICGDSDPGPYVSRVRGENAPLEDLVLADWILGAIERGAVYVDSPEIIPLDSVNIWLTPAALLNINASDSVLLWKDQMSQEESGYLAGIEADTNSLPFTSYRYQLALEHLEAANTISENDIHIVLAHVPPTDSIIAAACSQSLLDGKFLTVPDMILAGHYCGGVWNLPLLGAFYVPDSTLDRYGWFPSQDRVSGLREVDDTQIYVTRGLASSGDTNLMPFRLLNQPEISVIEITATSPQSMLD